ncbi:MAG: TlpA family protein disulfide reductase [Alphaproteobacteria bacterium]|nr:TlpA family protein disulfide reductase [Alphaproteobacteria bacterium]
MGRVGVAWMLLGLTACDALLASPDVDGDDAVAEVAPTPTPAPVPASAPSAPTPKAATTPTGVVSGTAAPALDLPLLEGEGRFRLDPVPPEGPPADRGAVMLAFMASWCGPCAASLPTLAALQASKPDLQIVPVVVDEDARGQQAELHKVRAAGLTGPVLAADNATVVQWTGANRSVPRFVFIGRDGMIVAQDRGFGDNVRGMMPRQADRTLAR